MEATSLRLIWLNQEEIHLFWLTQGMPFRQSADSLNCYSHVSNTMATCWSLWCSGKFSFLYNTCAHSLYPTLNFLSMSPWPISSMPSSTLRAYWSVAQMHPIFNNQSFLCFIEKLPCHYKHVMVMLHQRKQETKINQRYKLDVWSHLPLAHLCCVTWHETDCLAYIFTLNDQCIWLRKPPLWDCKMLLKHVWFFYSCSNLMWPLAEI